MRVHQFEVEVADDDNERAMGLMYRRQLDAARGMLFLYDEERPVRMWMKNTFIPLDMLFFSRKGRIVRIEENTTPHSERVISSGGIALGVLEINGGLSATLGLQVGDVIQHPSVGHQCPTR